MKFQTYQDKRGKFRWRLVAANGEKIASGQGYKHAEDRDRCIELLKTCAGIPVIEVKE